MSFFSLLDEENEEDQKLILENPLYTKAYAIKTIKQPLKFSKYPVRLLRRKVGLEAKRRGLSEEYLA